MARSNKFIGTPAAIKKIGTAKTIKVVRPAAEPKPKGKR